MPVLRARMIEQMQVHRKASGAQYQYVLAISQLAAYYQRSPDQLAPQELRAAPNWQLRGKSPCALRQRFTPGRAARG